MTVGSQDFARKSYTIAQGWMPIKTIFAFFQVIFSEKNKR